MRPTLKTFGGAIVLAAGLAAGSQIYANESHHSSGADSGMMGSDMMGMMNMMQQMGQMMESCNKMMEGGMDGGGGSGRPNEQWRQDAPIPPEQKG